MDKFVLKVSSYLKTSFNRLLSARLTSQLAKVIKIEKPESFHYSTTGTWGCYLISSTTTDKSTREN